MAFKQNTPLVIALLAIGALAIGFLALRPPPEDRLRQAAAAHAAQLKEVRDFALFGNVVDYVLADGRVLHVEFAEKDGAWSFGKDVGEDFRKSVTEPAAMSQIQTRLAQRLAARFNTDVKVKEGTRFEHLLVRDPDGQLRGTVTVLFAYPDERKRGRYVETWRYRDGRWSNVGVGSLFDYAGNFSPR